MDFYMDPLQKQLIDDIFDAFTLLSRKSGFVSAFHVEGSFSKISKNAVEMFGLPGEYLSNPVLDIKNLVHPEDLNRYTQVMQNLMNGKTRAYDITYRMLLKNGEYCNFRHIGVAIRNQEGDPGIIAVFSSNEGLVNTIDPITLIPNKNTYLQSLNKLISEGKNTISLMIGMRKLNEINKKHGYTYGNTLLQEAALILEELVSNRGSVYRLEGSAFAILSETLSYQEISALYDMIKYRFQRGIVVNGIKNVLSVSGGLASTYGDDVKSTSVYNCLKYAYFQSKEIEHGELVNYSGNTKFEEIETIELINTLRDNIIDNCKGFYLEYIPVYDIKTNKLLGAEGKICWQNDKYGKILSDRFIPIIERDYIFEELGVFIIRKGLLDGLKIIEKNPNFNLCLNLYRIQLESDYFFEELLLAIEEIGFPTNHLCLKFDKMCNFIKENRMKEIIDKLHKYNVICDIDGFGTGTNSIIFLKKADFDAVSIDEIFLEDIKDNPRNVRIFKELTKLAATYVSNINIKGVDNKYIFEVVKDSCVTTWQGEYFKKQVNFDELLTMLDTK